MGDTINVWRTVENLNKEFDKKFVTDTSYVDISEGDPFWNPFWGDIKKFIRQRDKKLLDEIIKRKMAASKSNAAYYQRHKEGNSFEMGKRVAYQRIEAMLK